ncbi:HAD family phosphatase [Ponticoccus sp. SC2-23]|uniref:HAD family hydrolase n=1 Tax=Alexandriicola marinus TaxID=2081710 RepID=UPI0013E0C209|nr:HAD family phosphatase [Alexandriicola marinus]MBM1222094.1 HAD family phosphatase [Ponticoccus sp. SC6-9]MBM1226781.1 HAD family phosphatase [Ponticoccus sp. SC6-15]MBM1231041.1 HAD family phosphatase [Ponticoccus sp. SC6-38]MBM1235707.1 HAD family phosphatase [Ponticoccus sp. SC6-45]MBM1240063.1 HAD family phosphatase [Ponticoccus sp. SC6-49]MBM1244417.1 HAD family phosphatase [Ponticoccus sp. SC2-64]MBM1249181.1 HAD family phosphatase [Ponticoccus sp. SC6-42]MBM1253718.1 HAD family ph
MSRFGAVIFDLDGTLLDTEALMIESGLAALVALDLPPRRDVLQSLVGIASDQGEGILRAAFGASFDLPAMEVHWQTEMDSRLAAGIPLRPGVDALLDHLDRLSLPRAVATNSQTSWAVTNLDRAGIGHRFERHFLFGRDRVDAPKPAPDLFLHAARALGQPPARCLVFEDSDTGVAAALAAGMTVVQVPDQRPPATEDAHLVAASLIEGARGIGLIP